MQKSVGWFLLGRNSEPSCVLLVSACSYGYMAYVSQHFTSLYRTLRPALPDVKWRGCLLNAQKQSAATVVTFLLVLPFSARAIAQAQQVPEAPLKLVMSPSITMLAQAQQVPAGSLKSATHSMSQGRLEVSTLMGEVLARHPSVIGSRYDGEAAEKLVDVARRQFYPTPTISMEAGDSRPTATLRVSQPVWTGGQLSGQLRIAELRRERAARVADEVQIRLALRVLELCQNYVHNSSRVKTMRWTVDTLGELTAMISRRVQAEVSSLADRRVAEARLAQAQADLRGFMVARQQAQEQLAQLLGSPVDLERLNWRAATYSNSRALSGYVETAFADWPSNRIARVDEMLAKQEAVVAKAAQWPVVSLAFEHRPGSQANQWMGGYENNRVLLTTQYTLGAGLSVFSQAEASERRAYSATQAVGTAERLSADAVVAEWQAYQSALSRRQSQAEALSGAQDLLASNRRLFVAGRRGWLDVVNSVREATQAEMAQTEIETVLVASQLRLQLLTGHQIWSSAESFR